MTTTLVSHAEISAYGLQSKSRLLSTGAPFLPYWRLPTLNIGLVKPAYHIEVGEAHRNPMFHCLLYGLLVWPVAWIRRKGRGLNSESEDVCGR